MSEERPKHEGERIAWSWWRTDALLQPDRAVETLGDTIERALAELRAREEAIRVERDAVIGGSASQTIAILRSERDEARRVAGWRGGTCYDRADYETMARDLEKNLRAVMAWFDGQCPEACPDNALHEHIRYALIRCNLGWVNSKRKGTE